MSMNFAREQSLLRQKLQARASLDHATTRQQQYAGVTFLGAPDAEVAAAAEALANTYPQMGRAQMTAFVRTLWSSKIHELRAVGVLLLAARSALLEPADLPLLEGFLQDVADDEVKRQLAHDVVGILVVKNKKLWKDLKRFTGGNSDGMRLAGVRGAALALASDPEAFPRFADLVAPLLAMPDAALQAAIDDVLAFAADLHHDAAVAFAQQHHRAVTLPQPKPRLVATPPPAPEPPTVTVPAPPKKAAAQKRVARKPVAARKPAPKPAAKKTAARKPGTGKPTAKAKAVRPAKSRAH